MKTLHTIYTSFAKRTAIILTLLLTLGVTSAWAAEELAYTITFSNSANGATAIATSTQATTVIAENARTYVTTKPFSNITYSFYGGSTTDEKSTIRVGKSGNAGAITIALSESGKVSATKVVVNCKLYNSSKSATLSVNNQTAQNISSSYSDLTFEINNDLASLSLATSQYAYIKSISVYKAAAPTTHTVTIKSNNVSYGTVDPATIADVANNAVISMDGNRLTVGSTTVTATPAEKDANYSYSFNNWSGIPSGNKVTANCTITANFTRTDRALTNYRTTCSTQASVTLELNGGSFDSKPDGWEEDGNNYTKTVNSGDQVTLPEPNKTGHDFEGWYNASTKVTSPYTLTGNTTLTAHWTPQDYTITYKDQGDADFSGTHESGNPTQHTYGTETTLKGATKTGYTFGGWYKEATCTNKVTSLGATEYTANITLYAQWEEIPTTCTITYDANGGEGTVTDNKQYTNGSTVTVVGNYGKLTKDGYAFTGWNTAADGSGDSYKHNDQFAITANTILYAQWCKAYWKLVTDKSELENDTRIVIAAKDYNVALSSIQNNSKTNRQQVDVEKQYNKITFTSEVQILSLVGLNDNQFLLFTGDGYLYAASSDYNYLKTGTPTDNNGDWSIAISPEGVAIILAQGTNTNNQIKYNSTSKLFSSYGSSNSQKDVVIYKEVCKKDAYNVNTPSLTNATAANNNPTTVSATATSLNLNYSANTGYLLPETITVKMGGVALVSGTDYTWDKASGQLNITVTGFYGDIDVTIVAEEDPCYGFAMSAVTATSTSNSITLSWTTVEGATGYNVKLGTGDFTAATGTSHTFEGLSPKTTYNWEVQVVKGTCEASKTGSIATEKETFIVSWVVNGDTENPHATESVVDGEKINNYPATNPSAPSGCSSKVFVGWTNQTIETPTNDAPANLYTKLADIPEITANTTFHAVWADEKVVSGGSGNYELITTAPDDWSGIYLIVANGNCFDGSRTTTIDAGGNYKSVTISNNEIISNTTTDSYTVSISKSTNNGKYYIKTESGYYIGSTAASDNELLNSTTTKYDNTISISGNDVTIKGINSIFRFYVQSGQTPRYRYYKGTTNTVLPQLYKKTAGSTTTYSAYTTLCDNCTPSTLTISADKTTENLGVDGKATVTFTPTSGNGGTITYSSNPSSGVTWNGAVATFNKAGTYTISASQAKNGDNCPTISNEVEITITATPVLYFTTTPADPIVFDPVNCGSTTVLANKKSVELQGYNLSGDVTVTVDGDYKIAKTSTATLADYSTTLTLAKTDAGKINGNYDVVYILSCPPAQSTDATTGTLTFTTKKGNTLTVNLSTPTVNCTTYALTFNDRGNKTVENYYAGVEVPQPEDPTGVCTDPIHYVFDGWAEATVTNGSTEYTKVTFPYTMPGQNKTLYAVYRYVDGNVSVDKFMSVDKEIGELETGKDYVLTGYYKTDAMEYALSITEYEEGKYKTKQVDVQESSTKYDDGSSYYEFETTDNEIIWTIVGDDTNGYTFQNKSNNKYLNINGNNLVLGDENDHMFTIEHETDVVDEQHVYYMSLLIQPKDDDSKYLSSYYKSNASQVLFNLHTSNTLSLYLYKRVASNLYTTSPTCGPMLEITSGKDIYVTSGYGTGRNTVIAQQTVEYRATRLSTNNAGIVPDVKVAANGVTMGGEVTNKVKVVELTQNKELIGDKYTITGTVTVQYTPTANDLQEDIQVQLAVDYNMDAKDNFTVHARSLPSEFVIAAKQGDKWYALNADMSRSDAEKANAYLQVDDIEDPTKATFAPCNTIYTFDGMVDGGNKEYMRFQGIDGKYLWAASAGNTGIQNYAKNTPTAGTIAYNWQLYTNDNETYQLQNEGNGRTLGLSKDLNFGMYSYVSTLQQDIRILPYEAKCIYNYAPTNLKVSELKSTSVILTWDAVAGATKYQYSTNGTTWTDAGTEPTVTINGLTRGNEYIYYVRAYHEDAGVSQECIDYAEIIFTTADCDDVPTDITYTADLNSITVTWTAVSTNCVVRLYSDEACTSVVKFADELNGSVTFSQLDRNTTYYVRVFAGGTCASQIIPVKTEDVKVDIVEWMENGIIVDINTNETVGVTLENEVSYGSGAGQNAEELFFSKYFEGSGSLKLLAIYNGTGKDVDLSTYRIDRGSNGDATNISKTYDLSQLGTIENGQEIIFYSWPLNTDAEASVYTCSQSFLDGKTKESGVDANPRWILCDAKTHNGVKFETMDFSGDDPLLFYKGSTLIDVFGVSTAADRPSKKTQCEGRSEESWSAAEVTNMDYGKTEADFEDGNVPEGVDLLNPTITAYTARVIMFRKNTVVSGNDAVTKNVTDFVTLADEWEARSVCHSGGDGDLTCGAYQELGKFDYSDYYTKYETMGDKQVFDESARNDDGTVTVEISDLYKQSCRNIRIKLSNESGQVLTDREYKVPIMITTTQGTDGQAFLALQENLATVEVDGNGDPTGNKTNLTLDEVREICKTCDVVVRDNAILTKADDDAADDHPEVRDVYVYENSSLIVPNGTNYTINSLSLRRKEDAVASVSAYPDALKLPESAAAPISLDFRLSAESWHWFTLPYDCNISEVTWVDGSPAQYNVDWFLMTYDGEKRAATQAGGCWKAYTGTTIKAGEGFILAINGNINNPKHTYELRFPMSKEVLAAEGTDKPVAVRAWGVETNIRPNHKGWNLVGNPYLAYYQRNNITNFEGLRLGQLTGPDPQTGYWEQTGEVPYIVVPVGAGWVAYEQVLASETDLLPFTAYFVQVGNDGKHNSSDELSISFDHTKLQLSATPMPASIIQRSATEDEEPIIVGVSLTNAKGESDKTSLIIDDQYTDEYEMHADFFKWFGDYYTYYTKPVLYTVGADQGKRAFNALNEELATQPVALGMYAAQAGEYTFTLDLRSDLSHVEEIWLHDATENIYTNLLQNSYTFSTSKVNGEGRFFLSVKMKPQQEPDPDPEPTPDPTPDSDPETSLDDIVANRVFATVKDNVIYISGLLSDAQLWIYDAAGRLMHYDQTKYYQHTYLVPQGGAYFVRVQGTMQTQTIKVVVK